jgi:hypothetical protein
MKICARRLESVLLISGLISICGCKQQQQPAQEKHPSIPRLPENFPSVSPMGAPAIKPRNSTTAVIALDDVKQYVATHPLPLTFVKSGKPAITSARLLTSKQVSESSGGMATGFPDDYQLYYVELQGPVTFSGPRGTKVTYNKGVLIFDAHTGNLVISGGQP